MSTFNPAEFWPVEPPDPDVSFVKAVGKMIYYGADVAVGENDALPTEPPPPDYYDAVKLILVAWEDAERIKHRLHGFLGFDPAASPPWTGKLRGGEVTREGVPAGLTFVHENRRTHLAVLGPRPMGDPKTPEHIFLVMADIQSGHSAFREKMLSRPDERLQRDLAESVIRSRRLDWGDIPFQLGKALLDTFELTGDVRYLDEVIERTDLMLANVPEYPSSHTQMPVPLLVRLYEMTGEDKYMAPAGKLVDKCLEEPEFRPGDQGFLQTQRYMHPETYAALKKEIPGGAGTYVDCIATHYMPAMLTARALGREREMADLVAMTLKEAMRHLLDPETGLFHQSILGHRQNKKGICGHGSMWTLFAMGLILEAFPRDHPDQPGLVRILRDLAEAVGRVQTPEGAFHCLLDVPATPLSSLYTPAIGCALVRGARMGFLPDSARACGLKAWEAIKLRTFRGGRVGDSSGTPVMAEYDGYFHTMTTENYDYSLPKNFWPLHHVNEVLRIQSSSVTGSHP